MLATHLGHYNTSSTRTHVRFQFSTHAAAGGNVAPNSAFENTDIRIYRANDGAAFSATQRSSSNGITMTSPFDSLTGFHDVDIDLTDNTDAGFYASGYLYSVVLAPDETVDSQTLTGVVLAYFEIGPQAVNVTQFGGTAGTFSSGRPEVNTTHAAGTAWASGAITAAVIATGAIDADAIADNAIDAGAIASDAITAAKIATGALTAAKFAAGAIDAAALAADAGTEIGTAVWATAARTLTALDEDNTTLDLDATIRSAVGLAAANLDTQLDALPTAAENATAVWGAGTKTLTAIDEDATTLDLDATIRAAVQAELDADITATPTAGSINDVLSSLDAVLPGSTIATATEVGAVETDTQDIQSRLPAALSGDGNIKSDIQQVAGGPAIVAGGTGGQAYGETP